MMRTILAIILLLAGFSTHTSAQNFDAGFIFGLAATQVDGDTHSGYNKAGPIAGIWVGHRLSNVLYSRMEMRYIQKGSFAKSIDNGSNYYRMRLNYFEIPLILGYRFGNGLNALFGLSGGYLAKAIEMNQYGSFPPEDIKKFHDFELAGMVGIEYNYSEHWAFNAMFTYSIIPIRSYPGHITYRWDRGQYNNVLELIARYKL